MALPGIGLQTVFGFGEESAYGTAVAPTRFLPVYNENLELKKNTVISDAIIPGGYNAQSAARRKQSTRDVNGGFQVDATTTSFGLILKCLFGASVAPTITTLTTGVYQHVYNLNLAGGKSQTFQKHIRDSAGTVIQAFDYPGAKISKGEFSVATNSMLTLKCDVDARDEVKQASPTASSYASQDPFFFRQGTIKIGGSALAADVIVKDTNFSIQRPMDVARIGIGNNGLKAEQAENAFPKVSGKFSAEFLRVSDWYDAFTNDTQLSLQYVFQGPLISGGYYKTLTFDLPAIFLDGESPKTTGQGLIATSIPYTTLYDGTNPTIKATYITTDAAP